MDRLLRALTSLAPQRPRPPAHLHHRRLEPSPSGERSSGDGDAALAGYLNDAGDSSRLIGAVSPRCESERQAYYVPATS